MGFRGVQTLWNTNPYTQSPDTGNRDLACRVTFEVAVSPSLKPWRLSMNSARKSRISKAEKAKRARLREPQRALQSPPPRSAQPLTSKRHPHSPSRPSFNPQNSRLPIGSNLTL